jgi:hypothetical protein
MDTRIDPIKTAAVHTMKRKVGLIGAIFCANARWGLLHVFRGTLPHGTSLQFQFAGRQSSRGRVASYLSIISKGEIIDGPSAAAAFAAAASAFCLTAMKFDQATIAATITAIAAAAPMILLISEISFFR